jgi:hypothetical protein
MIDLSKLAEIDDLDGYARDNIKKGRKVLDGLVEGVREILELDRGLIGNAEKTLTIPMSLAVMNLSDNDLAFIITAAVVQIIATEQ